MPKGNLHGRLEALGRSLPDVSAKAKTEDGAEVAAEARRKMQPFRDRIAALRRSGHDEEANREQAGFYRALRDRVRGEGGS